MKSLDYDYTAIISKTKIYHYDYSVIRRFLQSIIIDYDYTITQSLLKSNKNTSPSLSQFFLNKPVSLDISQDFSVILLVLQVIRFLGDRLKHTSNFTRNK